MPDIKLRRPHGLGLAQARKVAWKWAEQVEKKFGMECTVLEGDTSDTVAFVRSGVTGELIVAPDHFDLHARLGFLLGAFSATIEAEIERELDALLGDANAPQRPGKVPKGGRSDKADKVKAGKAAKAPAQRRKAT